MSTKKECKLSRDMIEVISCHGIKATLAALGSACLELARHQDIMDHPAEDAPEWYGISLMFRSLVEQLDQHEATIAQ